MKIKYSPVNLEITIVDEERAMWEDGLEIWYKLPKDKQPDFNPYDYFDSGSVSQPIFKLNQLAQQLPLNKVPKEIIIGLKNIEIIGNIYKDYLNHILGLLLKKQNL